MSEVNIQKEELIRLQGIEARAKEWLNKSNQQIRLQAGEVTGQEIRTFKAILRNVLQSDSGNQASV